MTICKANVLCLFLQAPFIDVASLNLSSKKTPDLTSSTGEGISNEAVQLEIHVSSGSCGLAFYSLGGATNRCELRHMRRVARIRRFGLSSPLACACCIAATPFMR